MSANMLNVSHSRYTRVSDAVPPSLETLIGAADRQLVQLTDHPTDTPAAP